MPIPRPYTIFENEMELTKTSEAFRRIAYADPAPPSYSCGFGHHGVSRFTVCTMKTAIQWLLQDMGECSRWVNSLVNRQITLQMFLALCDFTYNEGAGSLQHSTLLQKLNSGDEEGAWLELPHWCYSNHQINNGLLARRKLEQVLWLGQDWQVYRQQQLALPKERRFVADVVWVAPEDRL